MAWNNLRRQKLHTILSIIGGSIGVTLVIAALVFLQSFDYSGKRWVDAHFGPIEWELVPVRGNMSLTADQVEEILTFKGNESAGIQYLPIVKLSTPVFKAGQMSGLTSADTVSSGSEEETAGHMTVLGLDFAEVTAFDPLQDESRWTVVKEDQAVVSEPAARLLGLVPGDVIGIRDAKGEFVYFHVLQIVEELGIAGYRDRSVSWGTILVHEGPARRLAGLPEGNYSSVFATKPENPDYFVGGQSQYPFRFSSTSIVSQKESALMTLDQWKWMYGMIFSLTSGFAAVAGMLLVRQILLLQLDFRRESMAVLRAIGFRRQHVRRIFFAEAGLLLSIGTIVGAVAGCATGYGLIRLFQVGFAETLMRYSNLSIPLVPYLSLRSVLLTAAILLATLLISAWLIGGKAGKVPIVETLRAGAGGTVEKKPGNFVRRILLIGSCLIVTVHLIELFGGFAVERLTKFSTAPLQFVAVFALWLLASFAMLYLLVHGAGRLESRFRYVGQRLGIAPVSVMMAYRYPSMKMNRSYAVALMFSLVFTILITVVTFVAPVIQYDDTNAESRTFMGYPAALPYGGDEEREHFRGLLERDESLQREIRHLVSIEPFRLDLESTGTFHGRTTIALAMADEAYLASGKLTLSSRAAEFASDADAWDAVLGTDDYVILHESYSYPAEEWPETYSREGLPVRRLLPGDSMELVIYPNLSFEPYSFESATFQPMTEEEAVLFERKIWEEVEERKRIENTPAGTQRVKIAGFFSMDEQETYKNLWFVPPSFVQKYREYGFHWPMDSAGGYFLLDVNLGNLETVHRLQEKFLLAGFETFHVPVLEQLARSTMNRHMYVIYVAFMVVAVFIGMAGLAIVQHRAVRERTRQLAMMRFIGIGKRQIAQMFLLEGIWIGWTGIWNGALFGTAGGYLLISYMAANQPPDAPTVPSYYPLMLIMTLLILAMLAAWLLNLWPARRSNLLSPAEAIRTAD